MNYARTALSDVLTVDSIVTVYHINLANTSRRGEAHDFPEAFYCEEGCYSLLIDGKRFDLNEGDLVIYAPHAFHIAANPQEHPKVSVGIISFESKSEGLELLYNRIISLRKDEHESFMRIIRDGSMLFRRALPGDGKSGMVLRDGVAAHELQMLKNKLELFLLDQFDRALKEVAENEERVPSNRTNMRHEQFTNIAIYLSSHVRENLTLEQIAEHSLMSVSKLSGLFREQCGLSPIAYLNEIKIGEAKRLIRDTSLNFTEIAEKVGIGSVHYFSKLFKKVTGMTPSEYSRSLD